jgi:dUTP pyrophosphatase
MLSMQVPIRRVDKELPLPQYKTPGAVAMDCSVREGGVVPPKGLLYLPLNIALKPPAGHFVLMAARSSLHKRGLMMANNVAIFDEDYSGDEDEYKIVLYNFTDEPVEIKKGERLSQIILLPYQKVEWEEVETLGNPARGGYGTTGV